MNHNIHESIAALAVDIDTLKPLPGNPRVGAVDAIAASYNEFGQLKPIVVRPDTDGTATIIAGNHQWQAARKLGWTHIAAVTFDADDRRALAFALADNRVNELGYTDDTLLNDALAQVVDDYSDFMEDLGWDTFEMNALDTRATYDTGFSEHSDGTYTPAVLQPEEPPKVTPLAQRTETGDRLVAPPSVDTRAAVTGGSSAIGAAGTRTIVQYTLVFDDPDQQRRWFDFLRVLRNDPAFDGTISARLIDFLEAHADF